LTGRRYVLRGVVLLLVLGVSVAAAWWLVYSRSRPYGRGGEILRQIRRDGLKKYWPAPHQRWYLFTHKGVHAGWRYVARRPNKAGGFDGWTIHYESATGLLAWEHWQLNADATRGEYVAGTLAAHRIEPDTRISLEDGKISAMQTIKEEPYRSSAEAVPEYLPEGTLPLARHLVARGGGEAKFRLIHNRVPPNGGVTRFVTIAVKDEGKAGAEYPNARRMRSIDSSVFGRRSYMLVIDAHGDVLASHTGDSVLAVATIDEVRKVSAAAPTIVKRLLPILGKLLAATNGQTKS